MAENIKLPSKIVVDASVVLALLLPDEKVKPKIVKILEQYSQGKLDLVSTQLLDFEVLNGIKTAILRKRISKEIAKKIVSHFFRLKIQRKKIDFRITFNYSLKLSISIYDAGYLALAKKTKLSLATADKNLFQKGKKELKNIVFL